ncbi:NAD-dependent epimerase/dehydratase family protein [Saccharopolyspora taberi]|uniref:SDR family oxidoreductase n=1 Tax=Saccharopolyspora taberi TaxID=60895 RepID=A0ABN3VIY9_9PSEU
MRVLVLGGTRFIGRRITEELVSRGDEVCVVHRGRTAPAIPVRQLHVDRRDLATAASRIRDFAPDAVVDTLAMTRADAEVLPHLPDVPLVVLSSMDVYRAYERLLAGRGGIPVPIAEDSPLREERYPHRGAASPDGYDIDMDSYDKLDVEPLYLARGGTVLRLGVVYGERDPQAREEFVLRRVRAGRGRIPVGPANLLWSRVHVDDVAQVVLAALDNPAARGEIFNICESTTVTIGDWMRQILDAAGHQAELVEVADVPPDLVLTGAPAQHLLFSNDKARRVLGWEPADPAVAVARSVRWHLAHPPADSDPDFSTDDRALGGPACAPSD